MAPRQDYPIYPDQQTFTMAGGSLRTFSPLESSRHNADLGAGPLLPTTELVWPPSPYRSIATGPAPSSSCDQVQTPKKNRPSKITRNRQPKPIAPIVGLRTIAPKPSPLSPGHHEEMPKSGGSSRGIYVPGPSRDPRDTRQHHNLSSLTKGNSRPMSRVKSQHNPPAEDEEEEEEEEANQDEEDDEDEDEDEDDEDEDEDDHQPMRGEQLGKLLSCTSLRARS